MTDWADTQSKVKTLFARLSEVPAAQVIWSGAAMPTAKVTLLIQAFAIQTIGRPDSRFAEAVEGDNGPLYETIKLTKQLTLRLRVDTWDQRANYTARWYLDNVSKKLVSLSTMTDLQAAGLAYQSTALFQDLPVTTNSREGSASVLDLIMNGQDIWTDPTPYSRIESGQIVQVPFPS